MEIDRNDIELIHLLIIGDNRGFEIIYRKYVSRLFSYAIRRISDKDECDEIIQDVFSSLWQRRQKLGHLNALEPYLMTMVKYKIIHYYRHSKVKQKYAEYFRLFEDIYDMQPSELRVESLVKLIEVGLSTLPDRCQQAVNLRWKENLSNSEIAERMKIKKVTVENYFVTAIRHLKKLSQQGMPGV